MESAAHKNYILQYEMYPCTEELKRDLHKHGSATKYFCFSNSKIVLLYLW
jgi:hypothetical protein